MESNAFIIQLLEEKGGEIQGRVQLQKLVYFCKAMGVDVNATISCIYMVHIVSRLQMHYRIV